MVKVVFERTDGNGAEPSEVQLRKRPQPDHIGPPPEILRLNFNNNKAVVEIELGTKYTLVWHIKGPVGASLKMSHRIVKIINGQETLGNSQTSLGGAKIPSGDHIFKRSIGNSNAFIFSAGRVITFKEE